MAVYEKLSNSGNGKELIKYNSALDYILEYAEKIEPGYEDLFKRAYLEHRELIESYRLNDLCFLDKKFLRNFLSRPNKMLDLIGDYVDKEGIHQIRILRASKETLHSYGFNNIDSILYFFIGYTERYDMLLKMTE